MKVEGWDTEHDGVLTEATLRRKLEKHGYEVTRYIYPPGTRFDTHTHAVDKIGAVLSGRFRISTTGLDDARWLCSCGTSKRSA